MNGRLLERNELTEEDLEGRIGLLCSRLEIDEEEIRGLGFDPADKRVSLVDAAIFLYSRLKELEVEKSAALSHITGGMLSILLSDKSVYRDAELQIANEIRVTFSKDKQNYEEELDLELSAPQILRMIVFEHVEGKPMMPNYMKAKEIWGESVNFSFRDFVRGTKLPSVITTYEAFILGTFYSGSSIATSTSQSNTIYLFGRGNEDDLNDIIRDSFQDMFNIEQSTDKRGRKHIQSSAVYSWITSVLGYDPVERTYHIPNFEDLQYQNVSSSNLREAFLYGILLRRGRIQKSGSLRINSSDSEFLNEVYGLSREIGLDPTLSKSRIIFGEGDINRISQSPIFVGIIPYQHQGGFVNPAHIQQLG